MDKIDTTTETYNDVAKEGIPDPNATMVREIVIKINEIVDWINGQ